MTPARSTVLVVDDDPLNRRLLEHSLVADGHEVLTAEDGLQALEQIRRHRPDIVLLDVLMPELDGFGVLEQVKSDAELRDVPVIMISALEDVDSVIRCIELGAEDYLPKPFDPVLLRARMNAGLNKRRVHELEQARVRDVFARFLPESIVDEVLVRSNGEVRLGGVRLICTVLFTDMRGFTSFAESTPPDLVIEVLNRFLGEVTDAVLDNGGTLVTYLGDGVLAVFGAPIECNDHADRALATAREMLGTRLPRFNEWLRRASQAEFEIGIGVCSGPLMSGNVGSQRRLSYTAIGDTVNTAARIEAHTKEVPHAALVSQSTLDLLTQTEDLVFVDEITLRGRKTPTKLWGLAKEG
ncbi:MAG TPA: response regulator [Thermoleophilaceae bacterium]|nr:response regulator [Thermoleophilaceae bacterium]